MTKKKIKNDTTKKKSLFNLEEVLLTPLLKCEQCIVATDFIYHTIKTI